MTEEAAKPSGDLSHAHNAQLSWMAAAEEEVRTTASFQISRFCDRLFAARTRHRA